MELTDSFRALVRNTYEHLKGTARRIFMADVADQIGGQRRAADELGWGRDTIRKGRRERDSGISCVDAFCARGSKPPLIEVTRAAAEGRLRLNGEPYTWEAVGSGGNGLLVGPQSPG